MRIISIAPKRKRSSKRRGKGERDEDEKKEEGEGKREEEVEMIDHGMEGDRAGEAFQQEKLASQGPGEEEGVSGRRTGQQ